MLELSKDKYNNILMRNYNNTDKIIFTLIQLKMQKTTAKLKNQNLYQTQYNN